jgi:hypothetical protein
MRLKGLRITFLSLAACTAAFADTIVVPSLQANVAGNFTIANGAAGGRFQQIIGTGQFPGSLVITGIRYRSATGTGPVSATLASYKVTLSTTQAFPNTTNGHTLPSTTYANNVGPDAITVYNAALSATSSGCSGGGPCPLDLAVPFATPFSYDPLKGRLLVDVVTSAATGTTAGSLDGVQFPDSSTSSVAIVSGDPTKPTGALFIGGYVLGIDTNAGFISLIGHFPYGAGWISRTLIAAGSGGATVDVNFFSPSGAPATVPLQGQGNQSTEHLVLGPNAVGVVAADPAQRNADINNVTVSWAVARSSAPVNVFTLFDYGPSSAPTSVPVTKIQGSVGAQAVVAGPSFRFPASFYGPLGYNAGLAVANPNDSATTYTVMLLGADGAVKGSVQRPALPPNGQTIFVITDVLPGVITPDAVNPFNGSVVICASKPVSIVAIGVEGGALFTNAASRDYPCPQP